MAYTRKSFLKTASLATAGMAIAPSFLACSNGSAMQQYGIQLYTVRNDVFKNLETTLRYLAKAGYTQIELFGFDGSKFFGKTAKELKAIFDANGLTAPSGHYYLPPVLYNDDKELWKVAIDAAATMGHRYMVIPWLDDQHRSAADFQQLVGTINELAVLTKQAGMKLGYHNHEFEFGKAEDGKTFYQHLLDGTDAGLVDFEMDLYWVVYAGENPVDWFKRYPDRFSMWHIKDMTTNKKGERESTQVGDGTINFTDIFAQQQLSGLRYGFVEQEAYTMPEEECIKRSIDYLRKKSWGNT
jgi:sugar phosphate isomerase/epimerase